MKIDIQSVFCVHVVFDAETGRCLELTRVQSVSLYPCQLTLQQCKREHKHDERPSKLLQKINIDKVNRHFTL